MFAVDEHVHVEASWGIYQRRIAAYREPDRSGGRELIRKLIDKADVPACSVKAQPLTPPPALV